MAYFSVKYCTLHTVLIGKYGSIKFKVVQYWNSKIFRIEDVTIGFLSGQGVDQLFDSYLYSRSFGHWTIF